MGSTKFNVIVIGTLLAAALAGPLFLSPFWVMLLTQTLIYAIAAMALDMLLGYTDLPSLGQAGFLAVGAYTVAILSTKYHMGFVSSLFAAIGLSTATSAVLGLLALRAVGVYFLMITLAIAMIIWGLIFRWASMTGGDNGISGIIRPDFGFDLQNTFNFYYFILGFFIVSLFLMLLLIHSPFGKTLVGIKNSESRMRVLGYNTWLHKYLIFVIAGMFSGLAGGLYSYYNGFVSPSLSGLAHSMALVLMVIIGGPGTMVGAVIGTLIIVLLENLVSIYTERWVMVLSAVYVITALFAPDGIMGLFRRLTRFKQAT